MSSNQIVSSLAVALVLSVAGSSVVQAQNNASEEGGAQPADSPSTQSKPKKKSGKLKKHPNKTALDKLERGNPNSVIYKSRKKHAPNPTNAQLQAGETGNPDSVDYGDRSISPDNPTNEEINAAEVGIPDSVDYRKHSDIQER
jgi:hypothetical protein